MGSERIITNEGTFKGGYFILNPKREASNWSQDKNILFTSADEKSLKDQLVHLIKKSKESIKICSFILTDADILKELLEVLETGKVAVFLITQLDESKFSTSFLTEDEILDNRYQGYLDSLRKLYSYGAHIRASRSAHAKFIISDRSDAIVMSANITYRSLNENPESGIYLTNKQSILYLDRLFDIIFQEGTDYTKFISASKTKQFIISRNIEVRDAYLNPLSSSALRFTYESKHNNLYHELINIIQKAEDELWLSTFSIVGLDLLPEFVSSVKDFIKNNGKIKIFCRAMNYRPDHLKNCVVLKEIGCEIFGDISNHSKGISTNSNGMLFTANIDGNHGLKNGFEVGILTEDIYTKSLKNFIQWQILTAPFTFILNPFKKDYFKTYEYTYHEKETQLYNPPEDLKIKLEGDAKSIFEKIDKEPIYLYFENKVLYMISLGSEYFKAIQNNSSLIISSKARKDYKGNESFLLRYKSLNVLI